MRIDRPFIASLILALGVAVGGALMGRGVARIRAEDRYVTVKGVSERSATADLALWPLRIVVTGNDLAAASERIATQARLVLAFLARHGIDTAKVELQGFSVADALANQFRQGDIAGNRYVIRQTLMVRSGDPARVLAASQKVGELVSAGVVLSSGEEYGGGGPTFLFTGLNAIKPAMVGEATARAREAAEQFAKDSRTSLGGIRRADQGVFVILPRDQAPGVQEQNQIDKTIRVVSTVQYFLQP